VREVTTTAAVVLALAVVVGAAAAVAPVAAVGIVGLIAIALAAVRPRRRRSIISRSATQKYALAALWLALLSTLVFRARTVGDLAANPLDGAGIYRVVLLAAAGGLAAMVIRTRGTSRLLPSPHRWYLLYTVAVAVGIVLAVSPAIVAFRLSEMVVFLAVWYATHLAFGCDQTVPLRHLRNFLLGLSAVLAVNAAVFPSALLPSRGGILPYRLESVVPSMSANSVGFFGVLVFCFGLADRKLRAVTVAGGLTLVLLSQYRTGYVAIAAVTLAWLVARKHPLAKVGLVLAPAGLWFAISRGYFAEVWVRGEQTELLTTLNSRTDWWAAALQTWERSPVFGTGLTSGTRFEALVGIGRELTSTIHSTWVEALVGAGVVGAGFLGLSFVTAAFLAWRASGPGWHGLPLLLLAALSVRSITGTTFEMGSVFLPFFLAAASMADFQRQQLRGIGSDTKADKAVVAHGGRHT
jgi:hypothetical protein